ncbi:TPA: lipopolysaccharide biosynthesis protein, partial [Streptococcus suis]
MSNKISTSFAKIGIIYTLSNFIIKGMAFLLTPIFTRLMSQEEYGSFSNISSWANIISIIASLCLYSSISRAKYDYDENIKEYMSTITILGSGFTLIVWLLIEIKMEFWEGVFDMDGLYIRSIMLYSLFTPAVQTLITKHRMYNEYKNVITLTWITLLVSTFASLGLMYVMSNKLMGRVIGNYAIIAVVDIFFWIFIIFQGKSFSLRMCKYACALSLPLLIHELSGVLLNSSDRIIINQLCGAKKAALYSIAYTIAMVITVVLSSLNQAWVPWFFDKLEKNEVSIIKKVVPKYVTGFTLGCIGLMLIGPEMILIFGGKSYAEAVYV